MTENFMFWSRAIDVSGFRAYVACGIEEPRPDFWVQFDRVKPDGLLIVVQGACTLYYFNKGFDAVYDWADDLGTWAWSDVFSVIVPISTWMREALVHYSESGGYDTASLIFRFLDCTGTRLRLNTICGVDLYRMDLALLLAQPDFPLRIRLEGSWCGVRVQCNDRPNRLDRSQRSSAPLLKAQTSSEAASLVDIAGIDRACGRTGKSAVRISAARCERLIATVSTARFRS